MKPDDRERSDRRAKSNLRRKCMASGVDRLLTLTYQENVIDLDVAWNDFGKFMRKVNERFPSFIYAVVAERQKRGAVHFHLAISGFHDVNVLRALWLYVVGAGNVDIAAPRDTAGPSWKRATLARYLTKYFMKQLADGDAAGRHRYRCSRNISIPMRRLYSALGDTLPRLVALLTDAAGRPPSYVWESDDFEAGWACTWP